MKGIVHSAQARRPLKALSASYKVNCLARCLWRALVCEKLCGNFRVAVSLENLRHCYCSLLDSLSRSSSVTEAGYQRPGTGQLDLASLASRRQSVFTGEGGIVVQWPTMDKQSYQDGCAELPSSDGALRFVLHLNC